MTDPFALQGAADVDMLGVGHHEEGLDGGVLQTVDGSHGLFVFEVVRGAYATNNALGTNVVAEVDSHSAIGGDFHGGAVVQDFADTLNALLRAEHALFLRVNAHRHHHLVEERKYAPENGLMVKGSNDPGNKAIAIVLIFIFLFLKLPDEAEDDAEIVTVVGPFMPTSLPVFRECPVAFDRDYRILPAEVKLQSAPNREACVGHHGEVVVEEVVVGSVGDEVVGGVFTEESGLLHQSAVIHA